MIYDIRELVGIKIIKINNMIIIIIGIIISIFMGFIITKTIPNNYDILLFRENNEWFSYVDIDVLNNNDINLEVQIKNNKYTVGYEKVLKYQENNKQINQLIKLTKLSLEEGDNSYQYANIIEEETSYLNLIIKLIKEELWFY